MAAAQRNEGNEALVRRFVADVWNGGNLDALSDLATDDFVAHHLGASRDRDRDAFREFHGGLLAAVPDLTHAIEDVVADGDDLVLYLTVSGTPERQYGALAPTGESFEGPCFQKYRVEDGRVAELWALPNAMGMLRDLGIFPDSPGKMLRLMVGAIRGRLLGG